MVNSPTESGIFHVGQNDLALFDGYSFSRAYGNPSLKNTIRLIRRLVKCTFIPSIPYEQNQTKGLLLKYMNVF